MAGSRPMSVRLVSTLLVLVLGLMLWTVSEAGAAEIQHEAAQPHIFAAALEAEVDPLGEVTSCQVEYATVVSGWGGAEVAPCSPEVIGPAGSARRVTVELPNLASDTAYEYRFVVTAGSGRVEGSGGTFHTFGVEAFTIEARGSEGALDTTAGSHPYELVTRITLPSGEVKGQIGAAAIAKDILAELPPGLVGNPTAVKPCQARLAEEGRCSGDSQVGRLRVVHTGNAFSRREENSAIYEMTPARGEPARFGGVINLSTNAYIDTSVRTGKDYGITAGSFNLTPLTNPFDFEIRLWGVPADQRHDAERVCGKVKGCSVTQGTIEKPFLRNPTRCIGPLQARVKVDSYNLPGASFHGAFQMPAITGCDQLQFHPALEVKPTTGTAESPTGLHVDLHVPQPSSPRTSATPTLSCDTGTWSGAPSEFTVRWLRNGAPIPDASGSTYKQTAGDAGSVLQCEVEADNGAGGAGFTVSRGFLARPVPPAGATTLKRGEKAELTGSVDGASGDTDLTCHEGAWLNGTSTLAFRWFKNGGVIPGETERTLTLGAGEAPFSVQCEVLGGGNGETEASFSEAFTSEPAPETPLPSPTSLPTLGLPGAGPGLATPDLKDAVVKLPEGVTVNPSSANGLEGCTPTQIELHGEDPANCPDAAKIGTVEVDTPLLDHALPGAVYIASPYDNPFDSLLAIYIAVDDPISGVVIKLAGHVEIGPGGQLTTTFSDNPQLPFEDFKLDFFKGPRAALKTGALCGDYTTTSSLTPWSAPQSGPPATPGDGFEVSSQPGGGACPASADQQPNSPAFEAGSESPLAGAYTPFVLHLSRADGTQQFSSLTVTPPPGLLGRLAGVPYCPDASLAAASYKSGREEQAAPSCPAASRVGTVNVGAGAGTQPYYVQGRAYLAGPYKGAPLSLAIVTPAVAGPYDLGTVVVRSALEVDPFSAQITVKSDPIPTELKGIPLDVRQVAVKMDRPSFTLNPTNCEAMALGGSLTTTVGQTTGLGSPFQVGDCRALGFKPKLKLRLKGATGRTGHPALKAVVTYPKQGAYANIARAQVNLPHAEFLDQGNLNKTCTRPVLLAGNCPKSTVYGRAKAWSPLLAEPLQGYVYLVGGFGYKLPALVADLNGQIRVLLKGKVDSGRNKGIRNTFELVPDAPVSRFVLEMKGGKKYGLLENSEDLCRAKKSKRRAIVRFVGQNGKVRQWKPVVANQCGKKKHRKATKHHGFGRAGHRG